MTRRDSGSSYAAIPGPRRRGTLALALARRSHPTFLAPCGSESLGSFLLSSSFLQQRCLILHDLPGLIHRLPFFAAEDRSIDHPT
jgi:hypothetical protein